MTPKELQELESKCILTALKRGDVRLVKALTILAMSRSLPPKQEPRT